jgi:hypothetical protein
MDLPVELRLRIYELALVQETAICINRGWQRPSLLSLGPTFQDSNIVSETFFKSNTFVYYLTAYTFGEPDVRDLIQTFRLLQPQERKLVRKVNIVCFWAAKDVTMQNIRKKVEEEMRNEEIRFGAAVVNFLHTDDVWQRMWFV